MQNPTMPNIGSAAEPITSTKKFSADLRIANSIPREEECCPQSDTGLTTTFKWIRGELIKESTYAKIYIGLDVTAGQMVAIKQVGLTHLDDHCKRAYVHALRSAMETSRDLDHPNILQYLGDTESLRTFSICMEYVPGASIGRLVREYGKFDDGLTRSFAGQILKGLVYLHSRGIVHGNLKSENILVDIGGECKISDFFLPKPIENLSPDRLIVRNSIFWAAPEMFNENAPNDQSSKMDVWSVGCIVQEMWTGLRSWNGQDVLVVLGLLFHGKQPPPLLGGVVLTAETNDFRRRCFAINPEERPSASELQKHPYMVLPLNFESRGFAT